MPKNDYIAELEALIASRQSKTAAAKTASVGDNADDGLQKTQTGEQAAANAENSATSSPGSGSPDGGAKENPANASVTNTNNTPQASAAATDGSAGAQGTDLPAPKVAPGSDVAKIASDLRAEAAKIEKLEAAKVASVTGIARFLVDTVRKDEALAKTAADADDAEVADQAASSLMEQLQSGQVSEEDAQKILEEAVQSGAISPEDVQQALVELQGAQPEAPAQEEMVEDPQLEAKLAAADVGPNHPMYAQKLEALYGDAVKAGRDFFLKCANDLGMLPADAPKEEAGETPAQEAAEHAAPAAAAEEAPKELTDEEKAALEAAKKELGLDDAQAQELMSAPVPELKTASDRLKAELLLRAAFKK